MKSLAVDASRVRSGGAIRHIIGLTSNINYSQFDRVFIWAPIGVLSKIPDHPKVIKKTNFFINSNLLFQIFWQALIFPLLLRYLRINLLFAVDSSTFTFFRPLVVLNQDILAYENHSYERKFLSKSNLRLFSIKFIQNLAFKRSDGIIFLTNYAKNLISNQSILNSSTIVIPHGVDEIFQSFPSVFPKLQKSSTDTTRFVYLSNFDLYKHQKNVLLAVSILRKKGFNIAIDFIGGGEGDEKIAFDNVINNDNSISSDNWLNLIGHVSHDALPKILSNYDVFIFASSCESFGISLLEGMSLGMPIICSSKSSLPETLKDGGIYFDPFDVDSIVNSILKYYSDPFNTFSKSLRAKELSKFYTWSKASELTFDFLSKFINKKS